MMSILKNIFLNKSNLVLSLIKQTIKIQSQISAMDVMRGVWTLISWHEKAAMMENTPHQVGF